MWRIKPISSGNIGHPKNNTRQIVAFTVELKSKQETPCYPHCISQATENQLLIWSSVKVILKQKCPNFQVLTPEDLLYVQYTAVYLM